MSKRYLFFKRFFLNYIIIFKKKYGIDKELVKYKDKINYIIVDEKNNVVINKKNKNYYDFYYKKIMIIKILNVNLNNKINSDLKINN